MWRTMLLLGLMVACVASKCLGEAAEKPTLPMTAGMHLVPFDSVADDPSQPRVYGVFLPHDFEAGLKAGKKYPVMLFLAGAGARGLEAEAIPREGPIQLMKMQPAYEKRVNYIVVRPMIPPDTRSDNAAHAKYAIAAMRHALAHYPIDPDQVHLVGLSMGAETTWHAALEAPEMFATLSSVMGRAHHQPERVAKALKDQNVLIAVGSIDGQFTTGSRVMKKHLEKAGADLTYIEVPGQGHGIWVHYVLNPKYYDWLLLHRRGAKPEKRADAKEMLQWAYKPRDDAKYKKFAKDLQEQFHGFQKWWFVENCGMTDRVGRQKEALGKKDVFVTHPLSGAMPCRILFTAKVPKNRVTKMHLEVGHVTGSAWRLMVSANGHRKLSTLVGEPANSQTNWRTYTVDLTAFAGREVQLELLNRPAKSMVRGQPADSHAYWRPIKIESKKP
jgi:predicted esterase